MSAGLVADLEKHFPGGPVVRARLELPPGPGVAVLFGPSGSGKTTVLRCLAGLDRPGRGHVAFAGTTWFDAARGLFLPPQRRDVGYLSQDYALFPHLTVAGNIAYGLSGLPAAERGRRVEDMRDLLGLSGLEGRYPNQLSGGQQQRVALARALARRPRLLLLDEPLSALDAPTREQLRRDLRRLLAGLAVPAVVVTHDRTEALALGDYVVVLDAGRVVQSGPVAAVFARPADAAVARIVGVETVEPGRVVASTDGLATVTVGPVRLVALAGTGAAGEECFVCIRGEDVILEKGTPGPHSPRNCLAGRARALIPEGPLVRVLLDCGFPLAALVTRPACRELDLREGDEVTALVKASAVHLVPR